MTIDKKSIEMAVNSFTSQEMAAYEEYVAHLLSNGFLMREDAEDAACYRILQERDDNE